MRKGEISRKTKETSVELSLNLDGTGRASIATGVGFMDHMLTLFTVHGFFDLDLVARGDLDVDSHHTVEDVGICLGQAIAQSLDDYSGIKRYGSARVPMEETVAQVDLDLCRRPYLVFNVPFNSPFIGRFETEMIEEFLRALAINAGMTLHVQVPYGKNNHHMAEAVFKALGRALDQAVGMDPRISGTLSSKGSI